MTKQTLLTLALAAGLLLAGCSGSTGPATSDGLGANPYAVPSATVQVPGSGSTFAKPILDAWAGGFAQKAGTVQVGYGGGGSGKGISDITAKLVVFGASDAPLSAAEKANAPGILQFPGTMGAVAVVYNVAGAQSGLKLTPDVLGRILIGDITKWSHADILALNPGASLPDSTIVFVHRSDSSGTTFAFTDYLGKASAEWAAKMGAAPQKSASVFGPSTASKITGNGNEGVAANVKSTANSIGYVELAFVKNLALNAAAIENKAGEFQSPTTAGVSTAAAAASATLPQPDGDWSQVSIANADGAGVYPISSFAYFMVYDSAAAYSGKFSNDQVKGMRAFMWWALHDGQVGYPEAKGYASLPAEVVAIGDKALSMMAV